MKFTYRILVVLVLSFASFSHAQFVNEEVLPPLPYPDITTSISPLRNGFLINGSSSHYSEFMPGSFLYYGAAIPFCIIQPQTVQRSVVKLPASAQSYNTGFGGYRDAIRFNFADTKESLFVAWSQLRLEFSDIAPFRSFNKPMLKFAKRNGNVFDTLLTIPYGLHPVLASDDQQRMHLAYEKVNPIQQYGGSLFVTFSSDIYYQVRNGSGELSLPVMIGKGFLPFIKVVNSSVHILWYEGDTILQKTMTLKHRKGENGIFSSAVSLATVPTMLMDSYDYYQVLERTFDWNVDSSGNVQCGWQAGVNKNSDRKIFVLHYAPSSNTVQIDSSTGHNSISARFRFLPDGEVRIFSIISKTDVFMPELFYSISKLNTPFQHIKQNYNTGGLHTINAAFTDTSGVQYILTSTSSSPVQQSRSYLIRNIGNQNRDSILLMKGYFLDNGAYVDRTNRLYMTGRRDSTHVILNVSLTGLGKNQDFTFPLRAGNEWHYYFYPDIGQLLPETDVHKVVGDTLMPNGKKYLRVNSRLLPPQYYRKDGLTVFQYLIKDSTDRIRFDFSKSIGDTIQYDTVHSYAQIVLKDIKTSDFLISNKRVFHFEGTVTLSSGDYFSKVTDSLGIIHKSSLGGTFELHGAKINGKAYGSLVLLKDEDSMIPLTYSLSQNYPNPFNPSTRIEFTLPILSKLTLKIYDIIGREIKTLIEDEKSAGRFSILWNGENQSGKQVASGVYFYRLSAGSFIEMRKMVLLR